MIWYYLKPHADPEEMLHFFGCTPVFEELQQLFHTMEVMAKDSPVIKIALDDMTIEYV